MEGPGSSKVSSRHFSSDFSLAIVVTLLLANYGQASQALVVWAHVEGAVALWITAGLSLGFPPVAFDIQRTIPVRYVNSPVSAVRAAAGVGAHGVLVAAVFVNDARASAFPAGF